MVEAKLMSDPYAIANQEDHLGRTPLWQAISLDNDFDSVEIVRLLIAYGANLNQQCFGITPLSLAVKVGNSEICWIKKQESNYKLEQLVSLSVARFCSFSVFQ